MISERLNYCVQPKQALPSAGLFLSGAMKFPEALESRMYGNPEAILEAKQAQQAREKQQGKRRTLTVKSGWSEARKRAEALFDFAGASAQTSSPRAGAMPVDPVRREESTEHK